MVLIVNLSIDQLRIAALVIALGIIGVTLYMLSDKRNDPSVSAEILTVNGIDKDKDGKYPKAKEIVDPQGFVNTDGAPIAIADYVGKKVILVDFLTYSCINCVRVQPYLNAWHDKYKDKGLQIIGIHTPEFEFEKELTNVERAMKDMEVKYPVVLDNNYGTWRAYQNSYWPRKYIIDIDGYIVYDHIGEGGYEETERTIQELLRERTKRLGQQNGISTEVVKPDGAESVADSISRTPETYFGSLRNGTHLENGRSGVTGFQNFVAPEILKTNRLYLDGVWTIALEYAEGQTGSRAKIRVQAQKVFLVAGSIQGAKISVLLDGKPATAPDVFNGNLSVDQETLYRIVELPKWGEHTLELIIEEGPVNIFTFTFG